MQRLRVRNIISAQLASDKQLQSFIGTTHGATRWTSNDTQQDEETKQNNNNNDDTGSAAAGANNRADEKEQASLSLRSWFGYWFGQRLAPYVASTEDAVLRMLRLADVQASDTVYDLGSGDGRICSTAVKRGAKRAVRCNHVHTCFPSTWVLMEDLYLRRACILLDGNLHVQVGFELDNELMRFASYHVATLESELSSKIELRAQDVLAADDLHEASVLCCFLSEAGNKKLLPKLQQDAADDARLVSFSYPFEPLVPSKTDSVQGVDIFMYEEFGKRARRLLSDDETTPSTAND